MYSYLQLSDSEVMSAMKNRFGVPSIQLPRTKGETAKCPICQRQLEMDHACLCTFTTSLRTTRHHQLKRYLAAYIQAIPGAKVIVENKQLSEAITDADPTCLFVPDITVQIRDPGNDASAEEKGLIGDRGTSGLCTFHIDLCVKEVFASSNKSAIKKFGAATLAEIEKEKHYSKKERESPVKVLPFGLSSSGEFGSKALALLNLLSHFSRRLGGHLKPDVLKIKMSLTIVAIRAAMEHEYALQLKRLAKKDPLPHLPFQVQLTHALPGPNSRFGDEDYWKKRFDNDDQERDDEGELDGDVDKPMYPPAKKGGRPKRKVTEMEHEKEKVKAPEIGGEVEIEREREEEEQEREDEIGEEPQDQAKEIEQEREVEKEVEKEREVEEEADSEEKERRNRGRKGRPPPKKRWKVANAHPPPPRSKAKARTPAAIRQGKEKGKKESVSEMNEKSSDPSASSEDDSSFSCSSTPSSPSTTLPTPSSSEVDGEKEIEVERGNASPCRPSSSAGIDMRRDGSEERRDEEKEGHYHPPPPLTSPASHPGIASFSPSTIQALWSCSSYVPGVSFPTSSPIAASAQSTSILPSSSSACAPPSSSSSSSSSASSFSSSSTLTPTISHSSGTSDSDDDTQPISLSQLSPLLSQSQPRSEPDDPPSPNFSPYFPAVPTSSDGLLIKNSLALPGDQAQSVEDHPPPPPPPPPDSSEQSGDRGPKPKAKAKGRRRKRQLFKQNRGSQVTKAIPRSGQPTLRTKQSAQDPLTQWRNTPIFDDEDDDPFASISPPTREREMRDTDRERGEEQSGDAPRAKEEKEVEATANVEQLSGGDENW
jgi:hypothetical protein